MNTWWMRDREIEVDYRALALVRHRRLRRCAWTIVALILALIYSTAMHTYWRYHYYKLARQVLELFYGGMVQ